MPKKEKTIEDKVCKDALHKYQIANIPLKLLLGANTGWPDRIFLVGHGKVLFIEFKRPGEETEPKQDYMIELLRSLGYDVQIHDDVFEALQAIWRAKMDAAWLSEKGT